MLRLMGAVCLLLGGGALGWQWGERLRERVRCLKGFEAALGEMERELDFRLTPVSELFARLAEWEMPWVSLFFSRCLDHLEHLDELGLQGVWERALAEVDLPLEREEKSVLRLLERVLGQYSGESQQDAIRTVRAELSRLILRAEEERDRLGRVYGTLGLTIGSFFVLLLF